MASVSGYKFWDIDYDCEKCYYSNVDLEPPQPTRRKSKPKSSKRQSSQQRLRARYEAGDPIVDLLGLLIYLVNHLVRLITM